MELEWALWIVEQTTRGSTYRLKNKNGKVLKQAISSNRLKPHKENSLQRDPPRKGSDSPQQDQPEQDSDPLHSGSPPNEEQEPDPAGPLQRSERYIPVLLCH